MWGNVPNCSNNKLLVIAKIINLHFYTNTPYPSESLTTRNVTVRFNKKRLWAKNIKADQMTDVAVDNLLSWIILDKRLIKRYMITNISNGTKVSHKPLMTPLHGFTYIKSYLPDVFYFNFIITRKWNFKGKIHCLSDIKASVMWQNGCSKRDW